MNRTVTCALVLSVAFLTGCASSLPAPSGFLSDYSKLEKEGDNRMSYRSQKLLNYDAFIVDPVEIRVQRKDPVLTSEQRAEVANYMREAFTGVLRRLGYDIKSQAGAKTARLRMAVTDVKKATWWLNLHPASKMTGAGTGGAAMEGEVIDSVTGEQLAALIAAGSGNRFELDQFSALDDIKDAIDAWAEKAVKNIRELREEARNT